MLRVFCIFRYLAVVGINPNRTVYYLFMRLDGYTHTTVYLVPLGRS